jgi:hypothetical protein
MPKKWAIIRSQPVMVSGYPYPECILGGWTVLLTQAEKAVVDAKVGEGGLGYTGFDALDADAQQAIRGKLDANKQWEKQHGCIWFKAPPQRIVATSWKDNSRHWHQNRRRQVAQMIANDSYPVRTVIYRS